MYNSQQRHLYRSCISILISHADVLCAAMQLTVILGRVGRKNHTIDALILRSDPDAGRKQDLMRRETVVSCKASILVFSLNPVRHQYTDHMTLRRTTCKSKQQAEGPQGTRELRV
jgi:hypothetical protein